MTIDIHNKGSGRSHKQMKQNVKEVGMRKMKGEEFEKEITKMKVQLNVLMELLQ